MSELAVLLKQVLPNAKFRTRDGTVYSSEDWQAAVVRSRGCLHTARKVMSARPEIDDVQIGPLVDHLRGQLGAYVDPTTDRIGHSFEVVAAATPHVAITADRVDEVQANSSLPNFARGLIRAAAVLGPGRAAGLVGQWAEGKPRNYKIMTVLAGALTEDAIKLDEGLRAYRLPVSSNDLPSSTPRLRRVERILGRTLLEVDVSTSPALFVPPGDDAEILLETRTALDGTSFDMFLLALSLICNRKVDVASHWNDHGDAESFAATGQSGSWTEPEMTLELLGKGFTHTPSTGLTELFSFTPPPPNLFESGLRRAWNLRTELQRRMESESRFRVAVTRWSKAASPGVMNADRLIDLRVALEALYLDSGGGESKFRLSVTGARHLATGLDDRRAVRKALSGFYDLASKVIHGTALDRDKEDLPLVERVMTLCRDGILKVVEERNQPVWTDLLLS